MNKKILIISILAFFMLVAISFSSAVSTNTETYKKKESPLYRIRARRAITEKINEIVEDIKTRFIGERIFFIPLIDEFYRTGTRLWTSMCTQLQTMPGCGGPCK